MQPDDGRVVSNFIVQALAGRDITVYGSGEQTRSFCFVSDLIDGFVRLMAATTIAPRDPVNLGRDHCRRTRRISSSTSSAAIEDRLSAAAGRDPRRRPDIARARSPPGGRRGRVRRGTSPDHRLLRAPASHRHLDRTIAASLDRHVAHSPCFEGRPSERARPDSRRRRPPRLEPDMKLMIVGSGYVGLVAGACLRTCPRNRLRRSRCDQDRGPASGRHAHLRARTRRVVPA